MSCATERGGPRYGSLAKGLGPVRRPPRRGILLIEQCRGRQLRFVTAISFRHNKKLQHNNNREEVQKQQEGPPKQQQEQQQDSQRGGIPTNMGFIPMRCQ